MLTNKNKSKNEILKELQNTILFMINKIKSSKNSKELTENTASLKMAMDCFAIYASYK